MLIFLQLLIAHILGDFIFQPNHWVTDKREHKAKSKYLYAHCLVHFLSLLVLLQFNVSLIWYILVIVLSHYVIDIGKLYLESKMNTRLIFVLDQFIHLLILAIIAYVLQPYPIDFSFVYEKEFLLIVLAILLITNVSSIIIRVLMSNWDISTEDGAESSLKQAGKYIGILERLFVFGFVVANQIEAIGFLIAAKSVFRFSDLTRAKDRKLTEYVLIGTLLSFGLAILVGLGYKYLLNFT